MPSVVAGMSGVQSNSRWITSNLKGRLLRDLFCLELIDVREGGGASVRLYPISAEPAGLNILLPLPLITPTCMSNGILLVLLDAVFLLY